MKIRILSYLKNWKTKSLILIIVIFITQHSFAQGKTEFKNDNPAYKNSLKGFTYAFPFLGAGVSLGYERYLSKHSTIEIGTYYRFFIDEMGLKYHSISIMPAYKYYVVSGNKILNDFWLSVYLSYLYRAEKQPDSKNIAHSLYFYGLGGVFGKRLNLNKNHRAFFDVGFGISYNYYTDKSIFSTIDWWDNRILYRPVIQFGWKF